MFELSVFFLYFWLKLEHHHFTKVIVCDVEFPELQNAVIDISVIINFLPCVLFISKYLV